jgi:AcrR family transcriptional regulator
MTTIIESEAVDLGLRERKKQQTRAAIHQAAFRLIEQYGLEATTIEQICAEADVSTRTFFNYFPSKAAAALELPDTALDADAIDAFRAAQGDLIPALCAAMSGFAERGPSHLRMKSLIMRNPELIPTLSQRMMEFRGQFVDLASERTATREQAELAVSLIMAALGRLMHVDEVESSDAPLSDRLRQSVRELVDVNALPLLPGGARS